MSHGLDVPAHNAVVDAQFAPRAQAYLESAVHAAGPDLDALEGVLRKTPPAHAIDVGTGGGHVAYLLARYAHSVIATDLSDDMLAIVRNAALERGLTNIETITAPVEHLPIANATFDFLACRFSAHHWSDLDAGLRQSRRVLKPDARAIFIDAYSPGRPLLDTHLQAVELLRDASHVRDYSGPEWMTALGRARFDVTGLRTWRLRLDFSTWVARMRTPGDNIRTIRALQSAASEEIRAHFDIQPDGSFMLDVQMIEARASG